MEQRRLRRWELAGLFFTVALGSLLHFVYVWGGRRPWLGVFASVNESTWEHMKLLYWPWFLVSLAELLALGDSHRGLLLCRAGAGAAAVLTVPLLFYTLKGALGISSTPVHIGIFVLAAVGGSLLSYRGIRSGRGGGRWQQALGFALLWGLLFLFVYWTYAPPRLPLFLDPVTLRYGPAAG